MGGFCFLFPAPFVCVHTETCNIYCIHFLKGFPLLKCRLLSGWGTPRSRKISELLLEMLLLGTQFGKKVVGFSKDDCDEIFYPFLKRFIEACRPGCVWNCRFEQLHFSPTTATCQGHAFVMEHRWGPQQVSMMSPCPSNVKGFYITVIYCPRSPTKWVVTGSDDDDDDDDDDDVDIS